MKKIIAALLITIFVSSVFSGCGQGGQSSGDSQAPQEAQSSQSASNPEASSFNPDREITVISRESGSGTRGAFTELTGVQVTVDGNTTDMTTPEAAIGNGTNAIMTNVAGDAYAIGYISTGSIGDTIKPVSVDGVAPTAGNIMAATYKISRPFIIVTQDNLSPVTEDFISFIMSAGGQEVIAESYIPIDQNASAFQSSGASGTVVIGGSTSVSPIMEKLREAYLELNPGAVIEVHSTGSGAGITGAIDGLLDIGMSSREIRDSEMEELHQEITICMDGIAVIVNNDNPIENLTVEQIRQIFTGEVTRWSDVQ